jgi:hypothetical protein
MLMLLVLALAGCCLAQDPEDGKVWVRVQNATDRPIHAFLDAGPIGPWPITVPPRSTKEYWMLRAFLPNRVTLSIIERQEERR